MPAVFVMEQHLGHEVYCRNLRKGLESVDKVAPRFVEITYYCDRFDRKPISFLSDGIRGALCGRHQALKGLRATPDAVAVFNTQVPAVLATLVATSRPYVLCTDITPVQQDQMAVQYDHHVHGNPLVASFKHRLNSRVLSGAARLLPWSSWAGQSLVDDYGIDPGRVEVVAPGIDLELWVPDEERRRASAVPRILFVGGQFERKGGPVLLDAFARLPRGTAELDVVTRSEVESDLPGLTIHRNMTPNSPELIELYQSASIFALPSRGEAFGIAAAEASGAGLALVGARTGGLTDIIVDGETGVLVEPDDPATLAEELATLCAEPGRRAAMGRSARARAEARFSAEVNARRVAEIVVELAAH